MTKNNKNGSQKRIFSPCTKSVSFLKASIMLFGAREMITVFVQPWCRSGYIICSPILFPKCLWHLNHLSQEADCLGHKKGTKESSQMEGSCISLTIYTIFFFIFSFIYLWLSICHNIQRCKWKGPLLSAFLLPLLARNTLIFLNYSFILNKPIAKTAIKCTKSDL